MSRLETLYEVSRERIPACLPVSLDRTPLVDITRHGDKWRVFVDTKTGIIHDGAYYYAKARDEDIK